jgi:AmmeMemoRadiSam system protein A
MSGFTTDQGQLLVRLARRTIGDKLGEVVAENAIGTSQLKDDIFLAHHASFVTLTLDGQLRGCIGSLSAVEPVTENISKNALNAAFHDPRFPPLSIDEFNRIAIDISILSEPVALAYNDADDLERKLRPGIDGVIIRKDLASATFLPQVWEQLPKVQDFLEHLCLKAGLSSKAWRSGDIEVLTYQVQYFEEKS